MSDGMVCAAMCQSQLFTILSSCWGYNSASTSLFPSSVSLMSIDRYEKTIFASAPKKVTIDYSNSCTTNNRIRFIAKFAIAACDCCWQAQAHLPLQKANALLYFSLHRLFFCTIIYLHNFSESILSVNMWQEGKIELSPIQYFEYLNADVHIARA